MLPLLLPPGAWCTLTHEAPESPKPRDGSCCCCCCCCGALAAAEPPTTPAPMRLSTNSPLRARGARSGIGAGFTGLFSRCCCC
eukprot:1464591-Rhodomonas_salina.1